MVATAIKAFIFSISIFIHNFAVAGDGFLIYWRADDCGPCINFERSLKGEIVESLAAKNISFIVVNKKSIRDKWTLDHVSDSKVATDIFIKGQAPVTTPFFMYGVNGAHIMNLIGFNSASWRREHDEIVRVLFR